MTAPTEHPDRVKDALREIVAEHGPEALTQPLLVTSLLADFLPDDPPVVRLLAAAAHERVAESLREHVARGMDAGTAAWLVASSFASRTLFTADACAWATAEIARALGLLPADAPAPATMPELTEIAGSPTETARPAVHVAPPDARPGLPDARPGLSSGRDRRRSVPLVLLAACILVAAGVVAWAMIATSRSPVGIASSGKRPHPGAGTATPSVPASPGTGAPASSGPATSQRGTPASSGPGSPAASGYRMTATLNPGTPGSMTAIAWTPESSTVAVSDKDGSIYLWNPATGQASGRPLTVPGAGRAYAAAISPDGTLLAAGYSSGTTYLWNLASRQLIAALADPGPAAHREVDSVAFSPDGRTLVTADGNGAAYVWPVTPANQTTVPAMTLPDPAGTGVWSAVFSSRGTLATGDYAGRIYLWDLTSGTSTGGFNIPGGIPVTALAFSPGGTVLAAGSGSATSGAGSLYLFSLPANAGRFLGAPGPVWALSFAGNTLAAADGDGQTYLWVVSRASLTASAAATLPDPNSGTEGVGSLAFSPGGQWLVTGDTNGRAYVWMVR